MVNAFFRLCVRLILSGFVFCLAPPGFAERTGAAGEAAQLLHAPELKSSLAAIQKSVDRGDWHDAKVKYKALLDSKPDPRDAKEIESRLYQLNLKILFSRNLTRDSIEYVVEPGDSLHQIAQKFRTTIELIKRANSLENDRIYPGMKLKVSLASYSVLVDKSENLLKLFSGEELLKVYLVATGKEERTPAGTFAIETKLVDPVWYSETGVFPAGSPENILGTRWLGFSLEGYGIHGTTEPESIGTHATLGCVRMYNQDVEELYSIVPVKTKVTIVE